MTARLTALLAVIAVALLSWQWANVKVGTQQPLEDGSTADHQGQAVVTLTYDEGGKLHYRLAAAETQHYSNRRITKFDRPCLQLFNEQGKISWEIRADRAKLVKQSELYLSGNVAARSLLESTVQKITAKRVQINLLDQAIGSDQIVNLYGLNFTSKGNGMQGNLNQRHITLLNHVKTRYDPSPPAR